jgi:hypothetical protein
MSKRFPTSGIFFGPGGSGNIERLFIERMRKMQDTTRAPLREPQSVRIRVDMIARWKRKFKLSFNLRWYSERSGPQEQVCRNIFENGTDSGCPAWHEY